MLVNKNQEGNSVLKYITNVSHQFDNILCDYEVGKSTGVLFLSIRYHRLHPNYIYERLRELGKSYTLRIVLVLIDIKDPDRTIRELTRVSFLLDFTILLSWSSEEAAKYLETLKVYENKPLDAIKKKVGNNFKDKVESFFTAIPSVNKTDSVTLINKFNALAIFGNDVVDVESLKNLNGIGPSKAQQILDFLDSPLKENSNKYY